MLNHLKTQYGFNNFREGQEEIIEDILGNNDVVAVMATGAGKSLLFQYPATFQGKVTVVISPLISLMNDQQLNLAQRGIKSLCLNSESDQGMNLLSRSKSLLDNRIMYTTPEYLVKNIELFKRIRDSICLFAVDECHVISQWSHDFRPSYQKLGILKEVFAGTPILGVSATVTPKVLEDIQRFLRLGEYFYYFTGTIRDNIAINVHQKCKESKKTAVNTMRDLAVIDQDEFTIVYTLTRKECDRVCSLLNANGTPCVQYHAGMSAKDKDASHKVFSNGRVKVIVATVCFGMGIDKSDIRHVINYGAPTDIETYYQEIGRAGRDGLPSKATLFYTGADFSTVCFLINKSTDNNNKTNRLGLLEMFKQYLFEMNMCRSQIIESYFEKGTFSTEADVSHIPKCMNCDNCRRESKDMVDVREDAEKIVKLIGSLQFDLGMTKLIAMLTGSNKYGKEHRLHGILSDRNEDDCRKLIEMLISKSILTRRSISGRIHVITLGISQVVDGPVMCHIEMAPRIKCPRLSENEKIRQSIADMRDVPTSSILSDKVLHNITTANPRSMQDLWLVDGISQDFFIKYGDLFIGKNSQAVQQPARTRQTRATHEISYDMYTSEKITVNEIAKRRDLKAQTIESHIAKYLDENPLVPIDLRKEGLSPFDMSAIDAAIDQVGLDKLKPIKELVSPDVSYFQLRLYVAKMRRTESAK